ncbi:heme lyase CcmF/NrfE family subunit [soil metagenome]
MDLSLSLGQVGSVSVLLALLLALYGVAVGILGTTRRDARLLTSARYAAFAIFAALTAAVVVMEVALLSDDFSVQYVAEHSSVASPLWIKVVTLWAALEGSILLWAWVLSLYTALLAATAPNTPLRPWALTTMQLVQIFFAGVVFFVANPFTVLAVPPLDGPGPNPLLQNHWMMAVHPVLMYLGFVGLTVPFAYAMAALITRRPGAEWAQETRKWTLAGWGFLSAAIITGGWWSYEVLGWGGYWAWDPVENVSFLPWLTATAFIHSVQVQERRRMLKAWNLLLITLTFALTILGTFLTRSGVLSSVHAFGDGPVGSVFLGFFVVVMLSSFSLVALRWDQLRDRAELDSPVSREGSFLLGNVLFIALAFIVLLGTLFPLLVEATAGQRVTVGAPFFDTASLPLWMLVLALMGIGPLLPWRRAEHQSLTRNLLWMAGGAVVAGATAYALGVHKLYPLLTVSLAAYNLVSLGLLIGGTVGPRRRLSGRSTLSHLSQYAVENRRRFGSMVVHFGVVVVALGIAGSSGYRTDTQYRAAVGETVAFGGYDLTVTGFFLEDRPDRVSRGATVEVARGGRVLSELRPRVNRFTNAQQNVETPGVLYRPLEDVYLTVLQIDEDAGFVVLRAVQSPLISWIWFGGLIIALGTGYALVPQRHREAAPQRGAAPA